VNAWRLCGAVAIVALAIGGGAAIRDAQSASVPSVRPNDQVARLTKRVAVLERKVNSLQLTMQRICISGHLVSNVTLTSGQMSARYVHCSY